MSSALERTPVSKGQGHSPLQLQVYIIRANHFTSIFNAEAKVWISDIGRDDAKVQMGSLLVV
jgi:hypothetical protein